MGKLTWIFAAAFLTTSIILTVLATQNAGSSSVLDRIGVDAPATGQDGPALPPGSGLLPPSSGDAPALPPRADQ